MAERARNLTLFHKYISMDLLHVNIYAHFLKRKFRGGPWTCGRTLQEWTPLSTHIIFFSKKNC
jgi:hypothetical protein